MDIQDVLTRGVSQVLPTKDGLASLMKKRKIKLYQGFDPSAPSLHLGNFVGLMKLRQFQKLGHEVIFLVGDFTGMIGDPTDKLATRKKLTRDEVLANASAWRQQASRVIDFEGKNKAKIMFNSQWTDKLSQSDLIDIASNLTHQQLIERDMFQERLKNNQVIHFHELLYPIYQGYDSVYMEVDLEVGGNDQLFNMMVGRTLLKNIKGKDKYVLTTKLLVDRDGKKVGKTTGNALFLESTPENFYAGIMSFPDEVIYPGFELLTEIDLDGLEDMVKQNPMAEKKHLAHEVVKFLWSEQDATKAAEAFENNFQKGDSSFDTEIKLSNNLLSTITPYTVRKSTADAKRLVKQGAIEVNGETIKEIDFQIKKGDKIKIGKKTFGTII